MNSQTVSITIGGITKEVEITRLSPDHNWICRTPIVLRFPTGRETHAASLTIASNRGNGWTLQAQGFRNANRAFPVAWGDQMAATSEW